MEKENIKPVRLSNSDLQLVEELINETDGVSNFSSLVRHLIYTNKDVIDSKRLQKEIKKMNHEIQVTREVFTIYLEYLDKIGEGLDEGIMISKAEERVKNRESSDRTRAVEKYKKYQKL